MGTCQQINKSSKYLKSELNRYPQFVNESNINNLEFYKDEKKIERYMNEFKVEKEELQKLCPKLHEVFFEDNKKIKDNIFEYDGLTLEENKHFYYFFNKFQEKYQKKKIKLTNSTVIFPKFEKQNSLENAVNSSELENISLTGCKLIFEENKERYSLLENCTHLDLSYNGLTSLPEGIQNFTRLKNLYLRRNNLSQLPPSIRELNNLEELDLSENKFKKLQKEIFELKKMKWLNMNNNELESFVYDHSIDDCKLQYLFLAQNKLKSFPVFLLQLRYIQYIDLEKNQIDEIDSSTNEMIKIVFGCVNNGIFDKNAKGSIDRYDANHSRIYFPHQNELKRSNNVKLKLQNKKQNLIQISGTIKGETQKETENFHQTPMDNSEGQQKTYWLNEKFCIKNPKGIIEEKFNYEMKKVIEALPNEDETNIFYEQIEIIGAMSDYYKNIHLIENPEFKSRFKYCLTIYRLKKEYKLTGKYNLPLEFNDKKNMIQNYIEKSDPINSKTDFDNLHFITTLSKLIATDKIKIYMQYLGNVDYVIKQNLYDLWNQGKHENKKEQSDKKNEKSELSNKKGFIIMLTELKQFINDLYEFFEKTTKKTRNTFQVKYLFDKLIPENNPNDIISNEKTKNILLRLGTIIYEPTHNIDDREKKKIKKKLIFFIIIFILNVILINILSKNNFWTF